MRTTTQRVIFFFFHAPDAKNIISFSLQMFQLWTLPFALCDAYIAMDVVCSTASIFNLVAISIDRYKAVTQPMKYSQEQQSSDHTRVIRIIAFIWVVSSLLGLPIVMGYNASADPEETECKLYDANFIIYSSIASFYIPCFVILLFYYRIMKVGFTRVLWAVHVKPGLGGQNLQKNETLHLAFFLFLNSTVLPYRYTATVEKNP